MTGSSSSQVAGWLATSNGAAAPSAVDPGAFRLTMRCLAAGVTVVTTRAAAVIHGMTATAVCGVSLSPPLILICVVKQTRTHRLIEEGGVFAVHLLHQGQRPLADRFAGRLGGGCDRFRGLAYREGATGAPILLDCLGYLDCAVVAAHDAGDHTIFVGRVEETGRTRADRALVYVHGDYVDLPGNPMDDPVPGHLGAYLPAPTANPNEEPRDGR